jgi:hypothetical protein
LPRRGGWSSRSTPLNISALLVSPRHSILKLFYSLLFFLVAKMGYAGKISKLLDRLI